MAKPEEFKEFLFNQERIYSNFAAAEEKIRAEGVRRHNLRINGGYLVFCRHNDEISLEVEDLSGRVNNDFLPSILYTRDNVHTTILDYGLSGEFNCDNVILDKLAECVVKAIKNGGLSPGIVYTSWLMNQDTVITKGVPNRDFYHLVSNINSGLIASGLQPRAAWGSHITVSRFRESRSPAKSLDLLKSLSQRLPLGESKPCAIDVGHFRLDEDKFKLITYRRFKLA